MTFKPADSNSVKGQAQTDIATPETTNNSSSVIHDSHDRMTAPVTIIV